MKSKALWATGLLFVLGVTVAAYGVTVGTTRSNCPGTVTCPITGEQVCKDQCPLIEANRADCPGKIECPLTGEFVCRDECPLSESTTETKAGSDLPPCCRGKQSE